MSNISETPMDLAKQLRLYAAQYPSLAATLIKAAEFIEESIQLDTDDHK